MIAYLDHNATSKLRASARAAMLGALDESANASSIHTPGRKARAIVEAARADVAKLVNAKPGEVIFTSSGTEANVLALRAVIQGALVAEDRKTQNRFTRIFISATEHDSLRAVAKDVAETVAGIKLSEIPVTDDGVIDPAQFRLQVMQGKGRAIVAVHAANNETGAIQPLAEIAKIVRAEAGEGSLLHVDASQAAGKLAVDFALADTMTLSAHKFGGPQGAGALLVKDHVPFAPIFTGAQEMRRRAGTENVAAIAGFGAAAKEALDFTAEMTREGALRDRFEKGLRAIADDVVIFAGKAPRLPNTSNFAIPGLAAEIALIALDLEGVAVSSGAACSSGKVGLSHVLEAMHVPAELARGSLRVSLGWPSTEKDVDAALAALKTIVERTRKRAAA